MILYEGQQKAADMVRAFMLDDEYRVAVLTGWAGTGKSTTVGVIATEHKVPVIATPTGKAALRVTEVTGFPALTLHRLLYRPDTDYRTGRVIFTPKSVDELEIERDQLVIVDEASMVTPDVWKDLCTAARIAHFKILLVGDLFQLPPVMKDDRGSTFNTLDTETPYKVNLTEVVRQAEGSPIIKASVLLRQNEPEFQALKFLQPVPKTQLLQSALEVWRGGGVVIVHTNRRRHSLNEAIRAELGHAAGTLQPGEPLLVLKNNYDLDRYNGEVITFEKWTHPPGEDTNFIASDRYTVSSMEMSFGVAQVEKQTVMLSTTEISGQSAAGNIGDVAVKKASEVAKLCILGDEVQPVPHLHASYGYALTAHKSQGSEWDEVLVVLERSLQSMKPTERKRWVYTSITRARKNVRYIYVD